MTLSKGLCFSCISFIFGIFVASFLKSQFLAWLSLFLSILFLPLSFFKKEIFIFVALCLLFFALGIFRYQNFLSNLENSKIKNLIGKEVVLVGIIDAEPEIQEKISNLKVKIENEDFKILVKTGKYPQLKYGDKIKIKGKLKEPPVFENFNYKNYLLKDKILAIIDFPEIEKIGENFGNPLKKFLFDFKLKFKKKVEEFILPPEVGMLEALIFGDETQISNEWKEKLNKTGTRHITAVSGMNITILCYLILNFVLIFGFWRKDAILISLFLIFLYVLMIGAPPSAIRAAIMGSLSLIAQLFGRYSQGIRPVVFAATLMIFQNPMILRYDIGFQLSFLAILGLIYWKDFFFSIFKTIPNPKIFPIRDTLATTFSAQFFTLPLLIFNFGNLPLLSPISNLIIVPFLPYLTIFILFFGILATLFWPLGYFLSLPIYLFLNLILKIIDFIFKIPLSNLSFKISLFWLIIFYLILGLFTVKVQKDQRLKFLKY